MQESEKIQHRIGILGGTFDPIHNAHIELAQYAFRELELEKVIFIPAYIPPHKRSRVITDEKQRLEMARLAVGDYPEFEVSDLEIRLKGASYTARTLDTLSAPSRTLTFILGADSFLALDTWYHPEIIFSRAEIACACRNGVDEESLLRKALEYREKYRGVSHILHMPDTDISSTMIRDRVKKSQDISEYVPTEVGKYIIENKLYL